MSNQMVMPKINLLKLPDPAAQTAKFVNMMNATRQQEAAELQAARTRQQMDYDTAEEGRKKDLHGPQLTKAQQDNAVQALEMFRERVGDIAEGDVAAAEAVRADLVRSIPGYDQLIPPASQWTRDTIERLMMDSDKEIDKLYATPVASVAVNDRTGQTTSVTAGGLDPRAEVIGEVAPRATPTAPAPRTPMAPQTPTGPARTGKFGEALVVPEASVPLSPSQQDHIRQMQEGLGMSNTPASTNSGRMATPTAGRMSPDMVPAILDSAVQTGVMAQIDLDQMLALAPPQARQGIMDVVRKNNINLQADAPSLAASGMAQQQPMAPNPVQRPQAQFADMRGPAPRAQTAGLGGDMPMMRQTQAQSQGRTPFIARREAPLPGSAQVPLSRVAGEAEARRETTAQIQARKTAELQAAEQFEETNKDARLARKRQEVFEGERAKKDAEFLETYSDATIKSRTTLNVIDQMIGDARLEKGSLVVPKGGRAPHPGFEGVVGMGVPGVRLFPGTAAASFDALFEQAEGGAFLKAFNDLRGGGSITVTEGEKATSALTRMKRSQSEVEFVKAAREFADVLRVGIERADKKYTKLTGEAPLVSAPRRKTPTKSSGGWGKAKVVGN